MCENVCLSGFDKCTPCRMMMRCMIDRGDASTAYDVRPSFLVRLGPCYALSDVVQLSKQFTNTN